MIGMFSVKQLSIFPRHFSTKPDLFKMCFETLNVAPESDQNTVRAAFIKLVDTVHPESGHPEAISERFAEVDKAFRILLERFAKERRGVADDLFMIASTQYRQTVTPDNCRFLCETQSVKNTKVGSLAIPRTRPSVLFSILDRFAEEVIQEAISRGEFDRLSGVGKPLSPAQSRSPYVDFTQHKLNEIMIENGFTPEWIRLKNQIRVDIKGLKNIIRIRREDFGEYPLTHDEHVEWMDFLRSLQFAVDKINVLINKYNLIVPALSQQIGPVQVCKISREILEERRDARSQMQ